jgi:hypothetical protein
VVEVEILSVLVGGIFFRRPCQSNAPLGGEQSVVLFDGIVVGAAGGGDSQSSSCNHFGSSLMFNYSVIAG